MFDPEIKRELKSTSDFDQWLGEIKLFAQETLAELHQVAGLLTKSLAASGGKTASHSAPATPDVLSLGPATPPGASDLNDDPLSAIQVKLAKQLDAQRTAGVNYAGRALDGRPLDDPGQPQTF